MYRDILVNRLGVLQRQLDRVKLERDGVSLQLKSANPAAAAMLSSRLSVLDKQVRSKIELLDVQSELIAEYDREYAASNPDLLMDSGVSSGVSANPAKGSKSTK